MAEMMIQMMVGGSGMEHMKMAAMKPGMKMNGMYMSGMKPGMNMNEVKMGAAVQTGGFKVTLITSVDSVKVGKNPLEFTVIDPSGKPVAGAEQYMDMGIAHPRAQEGKGGHYTTEVQFSMKGPWRVTLSVIPRGGKSFTQPFDFTVKN